MWQLNGQESFRSSQAFRYLSLVMNEIRRTILFLQPTAVALAGIAADRDKLDGAILGHHESYVQLSRYIRRLVG